MLGGRFAPAVGRLIHSAGRVSAAIDVLRFRRIACRSATPQIIQVCERAPCEALREAAHQRRDLLAPSPRPSEARR